MEKRCKIATLLFNYFFCEAQNFIVASTPILCIFIIPYFKKKMSSFNWLELKIPASVWDYTGCMWNTCANFNQWKNSPIYETFSL
jgi:hypothetical protein